MEWVRKGEFDRFGDGSGAESGCAAGEHRWKYAASQHATVLVVPVTRVLQVCAKCGELRSTQLNGHWAEKDLLPLT